MAIDLDDYNRAMSTVPPQTHYLRSLTGLRFLAAFSVFVAHVAVHWPQFEIGNVPLGAAGVSFFYVLSGFILTYVYRPQLDLNAGDRQASAATARGRMEFSIRRFYLKRFARIWPLHIATLFISLFLVIGVQAFFSHPYPLGKLIVNGLLLQTWIPNYRWIYSLNGPSWSLSVEAFFYAVFPLLLIGGPRKFLVKYVLIIVATCLALWLVDHWVPSEGDNWIKLNAIVHANPLMRLFEFATGVGTGFLYLQRASKSGATRSTISQMWVVGAVMAFFLAADAVGMYGSENQTRLPTAFWYWFRFCGAAPVFAWLVLTFAETDGVLSRILSGRLFVYLGEISYSFYMVHMAVMLILVRQPWIDSPNIGWGSVLSSFAFSLFLASALYQLVEVPARRAIVGWYDGQRNGNLPRLVARSFLDWIRMPGFVPILILALGSGWFVAAHRFDIRDPVRIEEIVSQTDPALQGVRFDQDAILLGVMTKPISEGGLEMQMVWELKPGRRARRFVKLLDDDQQVIGRGSANQGLFSTVNGNATVIDRVRLPAESMAGVSTIAVGFYEPERKSAIVDRGPRSPGNRQLHVWSQTR